MPEQAQVTSVDAIEAFRANLIVFLSKAKPTLEEVTSDVLRTRQWLQHDQRNHWEQQMRLRSRELERAQAELFSARLSNLQEASAAQYMAAHRAQRSVREAEDKQRLLKKWNRELENRTEPMVKLVDQLHGFLTSEMIHAVAFLAQAVKTLQAYADLAPPAGSIPITPSVAGTGDILDSGEKTGASSSDAARKTPEP